MDFLKHKTKLFDLKSKNFKILLISVISLAIIIAIWGYFYGIKKVPWPEESEFSMEQYKTASKSFDKKVKFSEFGNKTVLEEVEKVLSQAGRYSYRNNLIDRLNQKFRKKNIIFKLKNGKLEFSGITGPVIKIIKKSKNDLQSLNTTLETADYFQRQRIAEKIRRENYNLKRLKEFQDYLLGMNFIIETDLVYNKNISKFNCLAGTFSQIKYSSYSNIYLYINDARPVLKKKFFTQNGLSENFIKENILKENEKSLNTIVKVAEVKFDNIMKEKRRRISIRIGEERSYWRSDFFKKWYSILLMAIISIIMLQVLIWYYSIIRRKDLPRKLTHEIYFATNVTSKVFRWIALATVILGVLSLLLNLIMAMLYTKTSVPYFRYIGFFYGFISPIIIMASTIIYSWIFVLISEWICFISNLYHIVFIKAFQKNNTEKKDD